MSLVFKVRGSKGDEYTVQAGTHGMGDIWMTCDCQAGQKGMYCKHRINLLDGDITALISDNAVDLMKLRDMLPGSDVEKYLADVAEKAVALDEAQRRLSAAKKALSRALCT